MSRTIAAISTAPGSAGLGVIRISGPQALAMAAQVFRPAQPERIPTAMDGYTAAFGHVFDRDGDIDECVLTVFRAPHSYTGDDTAELSCHGGSYLLQRTLRAVLDAGAQPAEAGEFTRCAFLNGKLDLTQAEAVMSLISAGGRLAAKTALDTKKGRVFRTLEHIRGQLLAAAAQFAAYVDYPDDDIPDLAPDALTAMLTEAETALTALLATFDAGRVLREGVDTAIVGCPNVGKSTLMNRLAGCERSIVTDIPGTTRDVVEETVRLGEVLLRLSDTAGIRSTADTVEAIGVERARQHMQSAAVVLAVFDGQRPLSADDRTLMEQAAEAVRQGAAVIALVNKADSADGETVSSTVTELQAHFAYVLPLSAKTGDGLNALERAVAEVTGVAGLRDADPVLATERQRACARKCLDCVREAAEAVRIGLTPDAAAVSVDGAIAAILELTGERVSDRVTQEIFARFCVGK